MAASGGRILTDPEDYVRALQEVGIELVITVRGAFRARLTRVVLPHLRLLAVSESLPRTAYVALRPDRVCVAFPLRAASVWGGVRLQRGHLVFHSRGERLHQRTNGPTEWGLLLLEPERLATAGRALLGLEFVAPPSGRILRPARRDMAHLLGLHAAAARLAERHPQLILHPEVVHGMEHDVIEALVRCLASAGEREGLGGWRRCKEVMDRFEDAVAAAPARHIPMPELCAAIDVHERTLRSWCAEFLGISPSRYLRLRRLRLAHIALRTIGSAPASVADVARRYGFSALGRFAQTYRATFGETPSTTLRRAKKEHA